MLNRLTFVIILCFVWLNSSAEHIDSLQNVIRGFQTTQAWDDYYKSSIALGLEFEMLEKYQEAIEFIKPLVEDPAMEKYPQHNAQLLITLGNVYKRQNLFDLAIAVYNEVLRLNFANDEELKAKANSQKASIQQSLGNYEKAYNLQMEALGIREIIGDTIGIARSQYLIGTIFFYQDRFDQALKHYEKAYATFKTTDDTRNIYSCLAAIGSTYDRLGDSNKCKEYNEQSLALAQSLDYKTGIAYSLGNLASFHMRQKDYAAADRLLTRSIQLKDEVGDIWGLIGSKLNQAELYILWGKPEISIPLLKDALAKSERLETKPRKLQAYKLFTEAYEMLNQKDKAYEYLKKFTALQDSVLNEKTLEAMGQSKRRYEFQGKEHEIEMLKQKNELLGKDKEIQKLQTYGAVLLVVMMLLIGIWFWNRYQVQGKLNNLLAEKNDLLNSKNDEIYIKNKLLEQSNQDLSQFAHVASHDLKEPLRMIHSYTNLLEKRYKHAFDESGLEFMHFITDAVGRMKILLDDILEFSRAGAAHEKGELIDLNDTLTLVSANLRHRFESQNAELIINHDRMPVIKGQRTHIMQLMQNLISNGAKFCRPGVEPVVTVDCEQKDDEYIISIKDNGIGIAKEHQEKVFEMFRRLHTRDEYEGTGIGLATCKRIVTGLGGDIWLESEEGKGTTFYFSLPCSKAVLEMA